MKVIARHATSAIPRPLPTPMTNLAELPHPETEFEDPGRDAEGAEGEPVMVGDVEMVALEVDVALDGGPYPASE